MHTCLDCVPCLIRQALEVTRFAGDDVVLQTATLRTVLSTLAEEATLDQSPPEIAGRVHRRLRALTEDGDPYAAVKQAANATALAALPRLRAVVEAAGDPFAAATHLAIAANALDMGAHSAAAPDGDWHTATREAASYDLARILARDLDAALHGDVQEFRSAIASARRILFLTDNCGEVVIDRLVIERLPRERLTVAVRGAPVLNDATLDDARAAGLEELATLIDNGSDVPGTLLESCSPGFRRAFAEADLIIAKGQGNYETLSDVDADVFFLFKVKCPTVARHAGLPLHAHALLHSPPD